MANFQTVTKPLCPVCSDQGIVWVEEGNDAVMHRCGFCDNGKEHALHEMSSLDSLEEISFVKIKKQEQPKLTLL